MAIIKKKCWPEWFEKFCSGERTFELRLADFDLKNGDSLVFEEYNPETKQYTGRQATFKCKKVEHSAQDPLQFYKVEDVRKNGFWIIELERKMEIKDKGRFAGSIIYLLFGFLIILIPLKFFGLDFMFYNMAINSFDNYPRLMWCLAWTFIGFSIIAFRASKGFHTVKAFPAYYTFYLLTLIMISSLVFSFFHIFKETSNYLFYFLSGPMALFFSYHVDYVIFAPFDLLSKLKK